MQLQSIQLNPPIQLSKTSLPDNSIVNDQYYSGDLNRKYGSIYIDNYCQQATMLNYALYVQEYNHSVKKYNAMVTAYNEEVEENVNKGIDVKLNSSMMVFCATNWNKPPRTPKSEWILSAYTHLKAIKPSVNNVYEYNAAVRLFNEENGKVLPLARAIALRNCYKDTFQTLLYWYKGKNAQNSLNWNNAGVYGINLPYMEFNNYNLSKAKLKNGAEYTPSCYRTFYNHRLRLEEAGILVKGSFHGSNEARRFYFNPQILVIWDMNQSKIGATENQRISSQNKKSFQDKSESTLLKNNIKNNGFKDSLPLTPLSSFYSNTPMQGPKKIDRPAAPVEDLKPHERKSRARLEKIESREQLAKDLHEGKHNYHQPLNMPDLYDEANNGTLSRKQTADYLSQEFLKLAARMWHGKDKKPYLPVWKTAIKLVMNTFYRHNGEYVTKLTMVEQYRRHVQRLVLAINFQKDHPGYNLLFPSEYFEPHRNKKGSGGYALTEKLLQYKEKERTADEKAIEKSRKAAARREFRKSRNTKMRTITRKYLRNKITYHDLYRQVTSNLAEYQREISKWIDDERLAMEKANVK